MISVFYAYCTAAYP